VCVVWGAGVAVDTRVLPRTHACMPTSPRCLGAGGGFRLTYVHCTSRHYLTVVIPAFRAHVIHSRPELKDVVDQVIDVISTGEVIANTLFSTKPELDARCAVVHLPARVLAHARAAATNSGLSACRHVARTIVGGAVAGCEGSPRTVTKTSTASEPRPAPPTLRRCERRPPPPAWWAMHAISLPVDTDHAARTHLSWCLDVR